MGTAELKIYLRIGNSPTAVREPPHVALANLQESPEAAVQFTRRWGPLVPNLRRANIKFLVRYRDSLQQAWRTDASPAYGRLPDNTIAMHAYFRIKPGRIECDSKYLWSVIVLLFLRDRAARKTAICANQDCPNPYFIKKRKTQKYCDNGPCKAKAQREQKLEWWIRNHGKGGK